MFTRLALLAALPRGAPTTSDAGESGYYEIDSAHVTLELA